jgi:predicted HTH transcriptional regulator
MKAIWGFIFGVVVGSVVAVLVMRKKKLDNNTPNLLARQAKDKQEHLQKILDFMQGKDKVTNNDIQSLLGVSDKTAERYFNELEAQGVVKQVGEAGKGVYYVKI